MKYRVFACLLCFASVLSLQAQTSASAPAKADMSQEAIVYERYDNLVRFENDGTGIHDTTAVIRVQGQAGVEALGQLIFGYSSATETLDIDYVRVRKPDGHTVDTPPASAQDFAPEILREAPMYSDFRQRHVSVVSLQSGDLLEYHTITHVKPLAPGQFWYEDLFPKQFAVRESRLQLDVPKSREIELKSNPDHFYETQETADRRIYTWTIKDFIPDRRPERMDEIDESDFEPDVQISTFTDWTQVAHWYAKLQGERVVVDEPIRQKAAELTRGATTPTEKARRLYYYVAQNIRYVSLSFGVGRLQPHLASEVLQNGYGDCKDKHTLLEALLRAVGIEGYPILINSFRKIDPDVPSPAQFDHEITAVRLGAGLDDLTWLDATAEVAPYGLIMYQLRNKQALLASDGPGAGLRLTPAESPIKSQLVMALDGKFTETGALDTTVEITAQGDSDLRFRYAFRSVPQANWQRVLQYFSRVWALEGDVSDIHLDPLEDIGKPFHLTYHFHKENYFRVPTSGSNFQLLPRGGLPAVKTAGKKKRAEPLDVGPAEEQIYRARIQIPQNFTVHLPEQVAMRRDYGSYSLSYSLSKNVLQAERHVTLKVDELPASRRADYDSFRNVTSSTVETGLWCSITPASAAAVASAAKPSGTPEEMRKAGDAALERKDFAIAADLLKRALDQDASQKDGWDDLGRAYAGAHQPEDAIRAFRKQIEVDPDHARANSDLAEELQQQGKFEDALAAYRKQAEITPSAKSAHKNLGLLLAQLHRDDEARTELETADSIPPDDPEVKMALAQVYGRTGNKEKSDALMKSVVGVALPASGSDLFAAVLRDDINPNQTLREARHTLDDIGDQFDSGEFDHLGPSAFSAMNLVALAWARIGWAKFLQGETMESMQFLSSAWMLSQSGTAGNRLARLLAKEGQKDKASHMFALAAAAGGADVQSSRSELLKLAGSADAADKEIAKAGAELLQMRMVKLPAVAAARASARFALVFDSASQPERAEFLEGDAALRAAGDKLREQGFPVKFPEISSVKIIRQGTVSCDNSGCMMVLAPLEGLTPANPPPAQ